MSKRPISCEDCGQNFGLENRESRKFWFCEKFDQFNKHILIGKDCYEKRKVQKRF